MKFLNWRREIDKQQSLSGFAPDKLNIGYLLFFY
jgi:hypothetical protein